MPESSPFPDPPPPGPLGPFFKLLIGCAVGCGGLLVLGIVGMIVFVAWLTRPGELLEPSILLGQDTTGYAEWVLRIEDPGTKGFMSEAFAQAKQAGDDASPLPDSIRPWLEMMEQESPEEQMQKILPMVVAWTLRAGADPEDDLQLLSFSMEQLGNRLVFGDWMLGHILGWDEDVEVVEHRGERLYVLPDESGHRITFFIRGNDVFLATDPESGRLAVDRLADGDKGGDARAATEVARLFESLPSDRSLRAAVSNGRGELRRMWADWAVTPDDSLGDATWLAIDAVTLAGGLEADGSLAGTLALHAKEHGWTEAEADRIAECVREGFGWISPELSIDGDVDAAGIRLTFRAADLLADHLEVRGSGLEIQVEH